MLTCGCAMQSTRCFTLSSSQSYYLLLLLSFLFMRRRICEFIRTQTILQNNCCKSNAFRSSFKKGLVTVSIFKDTLSENSVRPSYVFCSTYLLEHSSYIGHSLSSWQLCLVIASEKHLEFPCEKLFLQLQDVGEESFGGLKASDRKRSVFLGTKKSCYIPLSNLLISLF